MSIRINPTQNTQFVSYLGPPDLKPVTKDWEGDNQKRQPVSGKNILSRRATLVHRRMKEIGEATNMEPAAESVVTQHSHIKRRLDDPWLSAGFRAHSSMFPVR